MDDCWLQPLNVPQDIYYVYTGATLLSKHLRDVITTKYEIEAADEHHSRWPP